MGPRSDSRRVTTVPDILLPIKSPPRDVLDDSDDGAEMELAPPLDPVSLSNDLVSVMVK